MISIDFECSNKHRFEGFYDNYESYNSQLESRAIHCPICNSNEVKRLYTGCSIQSRSSIQSQIEKKSPTFFDTVRTINQYIQQNFDNVGDKFPDVARSIHYGLEEHRDIYGYSSTRELEELAEEGIEVFPLLDVENFEN